MIDNYRPHLATGHCQRKTNLCWFHSFCSYVFLFLSLALHSKTINLKLRPAYIFSIAGHVFRNLFLKMCPLFGQILITCLKCSRASFSPSSYSEKMRWGRGWTNCWVCYTKEHFVNASMNASKNKQTNEHWSIKGVKGARMISTVFIALNNWMILFKIGCQFFEAKAYKMHTVIIRLNTTFINKC